MKYINTEKHSIVVAQMYSLYVRTKYYTTTVHVVSMTYRTLYYTVHVVSMTYRTLHTREEYQETGEV